MNSLRDYHILYINLDNRPERKKYIEDQLRSLNLMNRSKYITQRISGVLGSAIEKNHKKLAKEFKIKPEQMKESF